MPIRVLIRSTPAQNVIQDAVNSSYQSGYGTLSLELSCTYAKFLLILPVKSRSWVHIGWYHTIFQSGVTRFTINCVNSIFMAHLQHGGRSHLFPGSVSGQYIMLPRGSQVQPRRVPDVRIRIKWITRNMVGRKLSLVIVAWALLHASGTKSTTTTYICSRFKYMHAT